ncbi:MAG TPA: iron-sulfur cluster repair di-iron protein [Polyangiaceae bacterium]|nr:iron-sulfur cluster repair di-iron protein [Polyangiaceae bacterium]
MPQSPSPSSTLAELAITYPAASRVFQAFGLDFCCKGQRPLAEACAERGLDHTAVLQALESATEAPEFPAGNFAQQSSETLIRYIVGYHHRRIREELPELISMAAKVERVHQSKPGCPLGLADHLARTANELDSHMSKEERVLFPMILDGRTGLHRPVGVMEAEHRDHGAALERTRELTTNLTPPEHACTTWRALYLRLLEFERELMDHVHLENYVLFPRALEGR